MEGVGCRVVGVESLAFCINSVDFVSSCRVLLFCAERRRNS